MKYNLIVHEEAIKEAKESYQFYEQQQVGLGERFLAELENGVNLIIENPKQFKVVKRKYRQYKIKIFPFVIVYIIKGEDIFLQCVFHTSRNPKGKIRGL